MVKGDDLSSSEREDKSPFPAHGMVILQYSRRLKKAHIMPVIRGNALRPILLKLKTSLFTFFYMLKSYTKIICKSLTCTV
jgi:hypothetical protein